MFFLHQSQRLAVVMSLSSVFFDACKAIHQHISCWNSHRAVLSIAIMWFFLFVFSGVVFALFGFVGGAWVFVFCCVSGDRIAFGLLGLRIGPCSLLIPQRGNDARRCTIRSTGTNTVLRPGESREGDGRKKNSWAAAPCRPRTTPRAAWPQASHQGRNTATKRTATLPSASILTWEAHMTRPFFQPKSSPISRPMKPRRSQSHIPNCASCCSKSSIADTQWKIPDMCVRGCSLASMCFNYKDERRLALGTI